MCGTVIGFRCNNVLSIKFLLYKIILLLDICTVVTPKLPHAVLVFTCEYILLSYLPFPVCTHLR